MTRQLRYVGGRADAGSPSPAAISALAYTLAGHARRVGLSVVSIRASRIRASATKHLVLRDARGRHWHVRISDHYSPRKTGHEKPHFDLVSFDAGTGFELAVGFVSRVSRGEIAWSPPERSPKRKGQR